MTRIPRNWSQDKTRVHADDTERRQRSSGDQVVTVGQLRSWQRRHARDIVAEVRPVPGMGTWDVCVWRDAAPPEHCEGGRHGLLTAAHRAADELTAASFDHRCDATCGIWAPVEWRKHKRV